MVFSVLQGIYDQRTEQYLHQRRVEAGKVVNVAVDGVVVGLMAGIRAWDLVWGEA